MDELPIDVSLEHFLEERALAAAAAKACTPQDEAAVQQLQQARQALMAQRAAFQREATQRRHARGEVYSAQRVRAINAMGPDRDTLERSARTLYEHQPDAVSVLKAHAQVHFVNALMSARLNLAYCTADIAPAAHAQQRHEEAFAAAWLAAIGDEAFSHDLQQRQREALLALRPSTRPMLLAGHPDGWGQWHDDDAIALGKAWNALDALAQALDLEPLSNFLVLPGEGQGAWPPAGRVLRSVEGLHAALQDRQRKFTGKKAAAQALERAQEALAGLAAQRGRAAFEVDL